MTMQQTAHSALQLSKNVNMLANAKKRMIILIKFVIMFY